MVTDIAPLKKYILNIHNYSNFTPKQGKLLGGFSLISLTLLLKSKTFVNSNFSFQILVKVWVILSQL